MIRTEDESPQLRITAAPPAAAALGLDLPFGGPHVIARPTARPRSPPGW